MARFHDYHGHPMTTHTDELVHLDIPRLGLFPGCLVGTLLVGIALLAVLAVIAAIDAPDSPARSSMIGLGVVAIVLLALGGLRYGRKTR